MVLFHSHMSFNPYNEQFSPIFTKFLMDAHLKCSKYPIWLRSDEWIRDKTTPKKACKLIKKIHVFLPRYNKNEISVF